MTELLLFGAQFLNYTIVVVNIRAVARGFIPMAMASEFIFCMVNFYTIQLVASAVTVQQMLAYAAGGTLGTVSAICLTRHWDHQ